AGPEVQAPMPGRVVKVLVEAGTKVEKGAPLLVVESMKMETEITAGIGGVVEEVRVAPGDNVNPGDTLVRIQPPG
ncbi:MAG TPA: biotin/lipoyl-binding protein, partial [Planctomycetes bacterium]|nr:biotin/lipoyl-binding protein [Planctomycetota bacterium]